MHSAMHCGVELATFMMEVKRRQSITNSAATIGVDQLKPEQMRALEAILCGKDTFVSLPTGYGKSIIFAALPLAFDEFKGILFGLLSMTAYC